MDPTNYRTGEESWYFEKIVGIKFFKKTGIHFLIEWKGKALSLGKYYEFFNDITNHEKEGYQKDKIYHFKQTYEPLKNNTLMLDLLVELNFYENLNMKPLLEYLFDENHLAEVELKPENAAKLLMLHAELVLNNKRRKKKIQKKNK